jgi:hypothetical protein
MRSPVSIARCAIALAAGCTAGAALAADPAQDASPQIERSDSALGAAYRRFVDAVSRGDAEEALRYFTDDAIVIAGRDCIAALPCVGKAAIGARYLPPLVAHRTAPPLNDQRFDGKRLRTRGEVTLVIDPDGGVTKLLGGHVFEFRDGRISSLRFEFDASDPPTAAYLAGMAMHALAASSAPR